MSKGYWFGVMLVLGFLVLLMAGCAGQPVIETQIVEKPVPVYCSVNVPAECKEAYAVDRVSPSDNPLTINRALRIEIEERWQCELKLKAAVKGCNSKQAEK